MCRGDVRTCLHTTTYLRRLLNATGNFRAAAYGYKIAQPRTTAVVVACGRLTSASEEFDDVILFIALHSKQLRLPPYMYASEVRQVNKAGDGWRSVGRCVRAQTASQARSLGHEAHPSVSASTVVKREERYHLDSWHGLLLLRELHGAQSDRPDQGCARSSG